MRTANNLLTVGSLQILCAFAPQPNMYPVEGCVKMVTPVRATTAPPLSEVTAVTVVFEGFVYHADGAPAEGAVVVSSGGGQAVTDSRGCFVLEAQVPVEAENAQITAVGRGGRDLMASVRAPIPSVSGSVGVGSLVLAERGTCSPSWLPTFGAAPWLDSDVHCLTVFDDGGGPALYAGGRFGQAGGMKAASIAKWDGSSWTALGSGMNGPVYALSVFDDGAGPALYAGGDFKTAGAMMAANIAKWDGSSWTALGTGMNSPVYALTVFDDGGGPALYAGGNFTSSGGVTANWIAQWDGASWSALGSGLGGNSLSTVLAMTVLDGGSGPALYVGGRFMTAGGVAANSIARWDGSNWAALDSGVGSDTAWGPSVSALTVFDDGGGPALYAGGTFTVAGGLAAKNIARWDGSSWAAVGSGTSGTVFDLTVFEDGGEWALIAGGTFTSAGGVPASWIAKWDGSNWAALGDSGLNEMVQALTVFDDGGGQALYAGGNFHNHIKRWDGAIWSALGNGLDDDVYALTVFDDGGAPAIYAAGRFTTAAGVTANRIAKWSASSWVTLGSGMNTRVYALTVFDDRGGPALYAGGDFTSAGGGTANGIAKWDGSTWMAVGLGVGNGPGLVRALTVFDDGSGPALYAGGFFTSAGGVTASRIAKWDGSTWTALGSGMDDSVHVLTVFDDGGGPALYAGGDFTSAGGTAANGIAKWDGSTWAVLGSGVTGPGLGVRALTAFDDGSSLALYSGGHFTSAGGIAANSIAKWDGLTWTALGSGMNSPVYALTVFDDGGGPALYAGGPFLSAGGVAANHVAKWNGSTWAALGSGMSQAVHALTVFDDKSGPALYAGGAFHIAIDSGDSYMAKWGCLDTPSGTVYCTAGVSWSGCQASISAEGIASSTTSSGFSLAATNVEGAKDGLFFFGTSGRQANPWGNGSSYQCVVPPVTRAGLLASTGTAGQCDGSFTQDLNALWCPGCPKSQKNPGAGALVQAQLWYRDPLNTSNQTTSLSDAYEFLVQP